MDDAQLALMGFARFYANLQELLPHDRPDDKLIENDEALDTWWENYTAEKTREAAKAFGKRVNDPASAAAIPTFSMPG